MPNEWDTLSGEEKWQTIWQTGPKRLIQTFASIHWLAFVISIGCVGITIVAGVIRWKSFLQTLDCRGSLNQLVSYTMVGYFFNSFLLGSTGGDLAKAYLIAQTNREKKEAAITAVVLDRLFGMVFMMLFALLAVFPLFYFIEVSDDVRRHGESFLKILVISLIVIIAFGFIIWKLSGFRFSIPKNLQSKINEVRRSISITIRNKKLFWEATVWSLIINIFCILQIGALCKGLSIPFNPIFLVFSVPIIITISALPLTPSGFGVRENLYVLFFGLAIPSIPPSQALAISLLAYAGTFFWNLIGGIFFLFLKTSQKNRLTNGSS